MNPGEVDAECVSDHDAFPEDDDSLQQNDSIRDSFVDETTEGVFHVHEPMKSSVEAMEEASHQRSSGAESGILGDDPDESGPGELDKDNEENEAAAAAQFLDEGRISSPSDCGDGGGSLSRRLNTGGGVWERPETSFIDGELAEVVAARSQHQRHLEGDSEVLSVHNKSKVKKGKLPRATKGDGKMGRSVLTGRERQKLEKEAEVLRKELHDLDVERERRRQALETKRSLETQRSISSLQIRQTKGSTNRLDVTLPRLKQVGPHTYVHSLAKRQERSRERNPQPEALNASSGHSDWAEKLYSRRVSCSAVGQTGLSERPSAEFEEETPAVSPPSPADDPSSERRSNSLSETSNTPFEMAEESLSLLKITPLSLFNKHWMSGKFTDILWRALSKEQQSVTTAFEAIEYEVVVRLERKSKEEQRNAELDTQMALRAYKKVESLNMKDAVVEQCKENQERLQAAEHRALSAQDAYHTLHERMKWKDHMLSSEEAELGNLRVAMLVADQRLEKEAAEYEQKLHKAFIEAAKSEQERRRGESSKRRKSQWQTVLDEVMKVEHFQFFHQSGAGSEIDSMMMTNRLRSAAMQHARKMGKDFVVGVYHAAVALEGMKDLLEGEATASFGVADILEYAGQWGEAGHPEGVGVEYGRGGSVYEGQWKDDCRHGLGAYTQPKQRVVYEGTWWYGQRHGFGVELHILKENEGLLPVALVEYDNGVRVSVKRFDPERPVEPLLLESVRRICRQARAAAEEGRQRKSVSVPEEEDPNDDGSKGGRSPPPRMGRRTQKGSVRFIDESMDAGKRFEAIRKERRMKEKRRLERQAQKQDLSVQKRELEQIENSVQSALKQLKDSTAKGFSGVTSTMSKLGLKSGRLYSMTDAEKTGDKNSSSSPLPHNVHNFLERKGVPGELADRIVSLYFYKFDDGTGNFVDRDRESKERELLYELSQESDWQMDRGVMSIRKRLKIFGEHSKKASTGRVTLPGVLRGLTMPLAKLKKLQMNKLDLSKTQQPDSTQMQDTLKRLMGFGQESAPVIITVPLDMQLETALATYNKNKHDYILIRPGTYRWSGPLEIRHETHIVGESGAKLVGTWLFKAEHCVCTMRNVNLHFDAEVNTPDYQRMVHVTAGDLHINDSALLCPRGYCLWTAGRSTVVVKGCILMGSEDGMIKAASAAVVMGFSRCTFSDSRLENAEESCLFVDNDAEANVDKSVLQCADIGVMLTDRAHVTLVETMLRLFRRGVFGQMRSSETELHYHDCTTHGELWGLGEKPLRILQRNNKHLPDLIQD